MASFSSSFSSSTALHYFSRVETQRVSELCGMLFQSKSTYNSSRYLTKSAVDWLTYSKFKQLPQDRKGEVSLSLPAEFFDAVTNGDDIVLQKVHYCQQSLSDLMSSTGSSTGSLKQSGGAPKSVSESTDLQNVKMMSSLINHDYLIVEIQLGGKVMYVKTEKASDPKPGIFITTVPVENISEVLHHQVKLFTVDCDYKRMPTKDLLAVLRKESPDYSLRDANCWDYALATTKHLLKRCAEEPGISAAEKDRLLTEHDSLKANLSSKHIQNTVAKLIQRIGNLI